MARTWVRTAYTREKCAVTNNLFLHRPVRSILAVSLVLAASAASHATDTYTPANNQLAIPLMFTVTGFTTFANVVVKAGKILSVAGGTPPFGAVDEYTPDTNQLFIPNVTVGTTTYTNVTITVDQLVSIGSVTAAPDSFAAPDLSLASVQVKGGPIYSGLVITVGHILSPGGGMPTVGIDTYDPATGQLTLESIELGGKVYTNPVITVGKLVSNGGALPPESVLYSFSGGSNLRGSTDGQEPSGLIQASDSYFYTTTRYGGTYKQGAVVQMSSTGAETVLYSFSGNGGITGSQDGAEPIGRLIEGSDGNLYGTTSVGGANNLGTVFRITRLGVETVLYSFQGTPDGSKPFGGLVQGSNGNYYGTTTAGGAAGKGTVFEMTANGVEAVLLSFSGSAGSSGIVDGETPKASLIQGSDGNFYGTNLSGGTAGGGTAFRITPAGAETVLINFGANGGTASATGDEPVGSLVQGRNGNFYGTTRFGGTYSKGTVFEMTPAGVETVLYSFSGGGGLSGSDDGAEPLAGLLQGSDGNFYGVTSAGGAHAPVGNGYYPAGTVFKVTPAGVESVIYSFRAGFADPTTPFTELVQATDGNVYGTAPAGGKYYMGALFRLANIIPAQ